MYCGIVKWYIFKYFLQVQITRKERKFCRSTPPLLLRNNPKHKIFIKIYTHITFNKAPHHTNIKTQFKNNTFIWNTRNTLLIIMIKCEMYITCLMMSNIFWLGGFILLHIFIIGYFERGFDFVNETCKNFYTYAFSLEYLTSLSH